MSLAESVAKPPILPGAWLPCIQKVISANLRKGHNFIRHNTTLQNTTVHAPSRVGGTQDAIGSVGNVMFPNIIQMKQRIRENYTSQLNSENKNTSQNTFPAEPMTILNSKQYQIIPKNTIKTK